MTGVQTCALTIYTGSSSGDRITNNNTILVSGLEPGGSWEFSTDAGSSWSAGSGTSFSLAEGSYGSGQVRVRQTDAAGNSSAVFSSFAAFTIDTTAAATAPTIALAQDSGYSDSDRITNNRSIQVSGLESGASWD